jgi:hypothetical protein
MSFHLVTRAHSMKFVSALLRDWSGAFSFLYTGQALDTRFTIYSTLAKCAIRKPLRSPKHHANTLP